MNKERILELSKFSYTYNITSYFKCSKDNFFINWKYVCDGHVDCFDGSDEGNCSSFHENVFSCSDGREKISLKLVCDFIFDCQDASDEKHCGKKLLIILKQIKFNLFFPFIYC